jgi:hypothetical protein
MKSVFDSRHMLPVNPWKEAIVQACIVAAVLSLLLPSCHTRSLQAASRL